MFWRFDQENFHAYIRICIVHAHNLRRENFCLYIPIARELRAEGESARGARKEEHLAHQREVSRSGKTWKVGEIRSDR